MVEPPAEARSLILFANSRALGQRRDLLADPQSAGRALARAGLAEPGAPLSAATRRRLIALRAALNAALAGDDEGWSYLDRAAARLRLRLSVGPDGTRLHGPGDDPVAAVLLALHRAFTTGAWARIRLCANDVCGAAFYDGTRSRTQRWHSYAMCGNRVNVAAHRARAAASDVENS